MNTSRPEFQPTSVAAPANTQEQSNSKTANQPPFKSLSSNTMTTNAAGFPQAESQIVFPPSKFEQENVYGTPSFQATSSDFVPTGQAKSLQASLN